MHNPNAEAVLSAALQRGVDKGEAHPCDQCDRVFESERGMHVHRASHGRIKKHKTRPVNTALFDARNVEAIAEEKENHTGMVPPAAVSLNYCSCCGVNLQTVEAALVAALG